MVVEEAQQDEVLKVHGKFSGSKDVDRPNTNHAKQGDSREDRGDTNASQERRRSAGTRRKSSKSIRAAREIEDDLKRASERERKDRKIVIKTLSTVVDMCSGKDQIILREILACIGGPKAIVQTARAVEAASHRESQSSGRGDKNGISASRPLSIAVVLSIVIDMCSEDDQLVLRVILDRLGGPVGIVRTMKAIEAHSSRSRKVSPSTTRGGEQKRVGATGNSSSRDESRKSNSERNMKKSSTQKIAQNRTRQANCDDSDDLSLVSLVREELSMQAKEVNEDDLSLVSLVRQELSYETQDDYRQLEKDQADDLSLISLLRQELSFEEQHTGRKSKTRKAQNDETDALSFVSLIREEMDLMNQRDEPPIEPGVTPEVIDTDEGSLVSLLHENPSYDPVQAHILNLSRQEKTKERKTNGDKTNKQSVRRDDDSDDLSLVSLVREELGFKPNTNNGSDDLSLVSLVRDELSMNPKNKSKVKKSSKRTIKKETPSDVRGGANEPDLSIGALFSEALLGDKEIKRMYGTSTKLHSDKAGKANISKNDVDLSFGALLREELAPN
mmetsp:Transcript_6068/g.9298  ORF Transcript_6068/g.9298 Transcript_6068/m.9298 type:complete len:558 (+) Transcript_6068:116-1789(+)|eukprot:CAMPEP_0178906268 /NCGR_PEP_ID=MMETSP0786-20121207/6729_1 /TAXON_ID=186022 /ORGANISM="Thalassionema frauenfeldii, Strain CCMP 1798" /LENGTH=557 /DNA_ID=CAMNT_0020577953 /DNA_START=20 /DNA_END=1693 /DNA_ORIENTATION=-